MFGMFDFPLLLTKSFLMKDSCITETKITTLSLSLSKAKYFDFDEVYILEQGIIYL